MGVCYVIMKMGWGMNLAFLIFICLLFLSSARTSQASVPDIGDWIEYETNDGGAIFYSFDGIRTTNDDSYAVDGWQDVTTIDAPVSLS